MRSTATHIAWSVCVCLLQGHKRQPCKKAIESIEMHAVWVWTRKAQGTITVLDAAGISYEKRHFWGNGNTRAYSDLPAVDILSLIYKVAAAMWPLVTVFIATCYAPAVGGH